jgi:hypothetical protein
LTLAAGAIPPCAEAESAQGIFKCLERRFAGSDAASPKSDRRSGQIPPPESAPLGRARSSNQPLDEEFHHPRLIDGRVPLVGTHLHLEAFARRLQRRMISCSAFFG